MTILGSGVYQAPDSGHRETIQAIIMDLLGTVGSRTVCPHPDRALFAECCNPGELNCSTCMIFRSPAEACVFCCSCGARTPTSPAARAAAGCDLVLASGGGITVVAAFCGPCAGVAREIRPQIINARG